MSIKIKSKALEVYDNGTKIALDGFGGKDGKDGKDWIPTTEELDSIATDASDKLKNTVIKEYVVTNLADVTNNTKLAINRTVNEYSVATEEELNSVTDKVNGMVGTTTQYPSPFLTTEGSFLIHENKLWRCKVDFPESEPNEYSNEWELVSLKSIAIKQAQATKTEDVYGTNELWSNIEQYNVGDYVIYDNKLWKCVTTHNGQTPSEGTYWMQISLKSLKNDMDVIGTVYTGGSKYWENNTLVTVPSGTYIISFENAVSNVSSDGLCISLQNNTKGTAIGMAMTFFHNGNWSFVRIATFDSQTNIGTKRYWGSTTNDNYSCSVTAIRIK